MKKRYGPLRRAAALLLCLCVIAAQPAALAAGSSTDYADSLYKLGVFYGTENGYELDRTLTRAEGVALEVTPEELEGVLGKFQSYRQA